MLKNDPRYTAYVSILREELVPAMGCTEPISVAYAAAKAREVLGCIPDRIRIGCSGSIIKNVKSVIVPNTGGLKGLEAAAAAGVIAGDAARSLEVISGTLPSQQQEIRDYLARADISVSHLTGDRVFEIVMTVSRGGETATVRITDTHTNITLIEKNGQQFNAGDGLVVKGVDANVENVGRLGREGMRDTNREIIEMMLGRFSDPRPGSGKTPKGS